jgi:hypothetical protein
VRLKSVFDPACDSFPNRLGLLFRVIESLDRRNGEIERHRFSPAAAWPTEPSISLDGAMFG